MSDELLLAVDAGTGSCRALLFTPDLVIMDLDLGEEAMSGWEATRQIKEDPETRSRGTE